MSWLGKGFSDAATGTRIRRMLGHCTEQVFVIVREDTREPTKDLLNSMHDVFKRHEHRKIAARVAN